MKYVEIYEKITKRLIRIVYVKNFEHALDIFILPGEHKNVYCKDSNKSQTHTITTIRKKLNK